VSKVDEFKPQELANVVWALASMEHYSPQLMEVCFCENSACLSCMNLVIGWSHLLVLESSRRVSYRSIWAACWC
jgi:hypothetical protein